MKHFNLILALILTMQTAFAGVITDDKLELGKPSSSSDKQLIFKGPTSKTLKSSSAGALNYNGNGLIVGDGANTADKTITFNKGVNSPSIKYNFATGTIQFSNDNVNFLDMGSGSGGAGGIQMLSDPEFEKATISTYWTASAGTLAAVTSGGNFSGFDKQSASWTPAASSNTLSSETITIVNGLLGARGSASIFYKTTSALHKLQIYDGSTVIAEKLLPASSGFKKEEFSFSIPTSGTIQFRILSGDTTAIYVDKAFLGVPSSQPADEDFVVVKNLFPNPKAEGTSPSWLAYKDAAGLVPVDGVNGSPTLSCSLSSSSPLEGTKSFLITKPASNVQGEGCAHDLKVLEETHKAKVLQVSFEYKIASGTYTDDTLKLYAYDIDNAQLFELAPTFIKNSSLTEPYKATFQTSLTGTKYRLIWHYAGTDTVATSIKVDNIRVSTQLITTGSFATDWQTYTTGCSGTWTTNTTYECKSRIVGDSMEFQIKATLTGAPNAVQFAANLPVSIDSSKVVANFGAVGNSTFQDSGVASYMGGIQILGTTIYPYTSQTPSNGVTTTIPFTWGNADSLTLDFRVPVVGKTANTVLSSEYTSQNIVVGLSGGSTAGTNNTSLKVTGAAVNSASRDSLGAWSTSNNRYDIKVSGFYEFFASGYFVPTGGATDSFNIITLYKNNAVLLDLARRDTKGTENQTISVWIAGNSFPVYLAAGDYVEFYANQNSGVTRAFNGSYFGIKKVDSGATQVASSETVSAGYSSAAGQSIADNGSLALLSTKDWDDTSAVLSSVFRAPNPGTYQACGTFTFVANGSGIRNLKLYKNGSVYKSGTSILGSASNNLTISNCFDAKLLTGETLQFFVFQNIGVALSLTPNASENWVTYKRTGNY